MSAHRIILGITSFICLISPSSSYLNLYLDLSETFRLLGITGELFYVRNGIINNYALSFNLPISANINEIYFHWQSLRTNPPSMFYSMKFNISNSRAMNEPIANISKEGTVPNTLSVFSIKFPCTGLVTTDVQIKLQLSISIFSASNSTVLNFKRRKTCLRDPLLQNKNKYFYNNPPDVQNNNNILQSTSPTDKYPEAKDQPLTMSTHIFYISVGCACAVILLIALAVAVYYLNTQKSGSHGYTDRIKYYDSSSSQALTYQQSQSFLRSETPVEGSVKGSIRNFPSYSSPSPIPELQPPDPKEILSEIAISRQRISLGEMLLEGTFGRIYHGTLLSEGDSHFGADQEITVKAITDQARCDQIHVFLTECCMMKGLVHQNIQPVIGSCLDESPPYVIYPYSTEGNLKKFLLKCRVSDCGSIYSLSTQQLVFLAIQIIRGIQFLHRKKIIHKDIATRNCVLDSDLVLKLTDTALSRDLFSGDYDCLGDNENRPVKWLALEALLERRFSPASDVWAFGVTLWELMTLGQQPYSDIDPFEMAAYLQEGYRIAQPVNCPDELFSVMACCWGGNPEERPKFSQLLICLQDFYTALGRYV